MGSEPVDIEEYVRTVSEMVNETFYPQVPEPNMKKYHVRDKELGKCAMLVCNALFNAQRAVITNGSTTTPSNCQHTATAYTSIYTATYWT
jgi:hypothetical protein